MNRRKFIAFPAPRRGGAGSFLTVFCLIVLGLSPVHGDQSATDRVAIVVSKHIRPYVEAVEGLKSGFSAYANIVPRVFNLEKLNNQARAGLFEDERVNGFSLFIAVGPEAAASVWKGVGNKGPAKLYVMVLHPEKLLGEREKLFGVPLNIPVGTQVEMIHRGLPSVRQIGLLYDPEHNRAFFRRAADAAAALNLTVVPLRVASKKGIPGALQGRWTDMDALWLIPDRTVISERIVRYLIKDAFLQQRPVIGYNRFFYETGAALAFVFDYRALGRQCAQQALRILSGQSCRETPPVFHVWVNKGVCDKLGLRYPEEYMPPLSPGP
ncbi:MAG: hypothetical protein K9M96_10565 [Deltaproteobacteria bacterium]|nr:hypothetical protein [Deltaproteobacteria bacterium]